jgi:hypothetical protein
VTIRVPVSSAQIVTKFSEPAAELG